MMSVPSDEYASPQEAGRSAIDYVRDAFIGGLAIVVPFVVTLVVLATIVQYIVRYLGTVIGVAPGAQAGPLTITVAVVLLLALVLLVGFVTQFRYGEVFIDYVDAVLSRIPGFGSIYDSFREMSDVMMESDQESFRDVKLVEFPHEGAFTLGFLTAESAGALKDAAGRQDLVTLFLPLAPNPVMGGHLVHVPADRVMDVDMTVDEGIRTVVTSGVATGGPSASGGDSNAGLSADEMERLAADSGTAVGATGTDGADDRARRRHGADASTREGAYEEHAAPDAAHDEPVPSGVASYRDDDRLGEAGTTPAAVESDGAATLGGEHATPDDVVAEGDGDRSLGADADRPSEVADATGRWRDESRDGE